MIIVKDMIQHGVTLYKRRILRKIISLLEPDMHGWNYGSKRCQWTLEYMIPLAHVHNNILALKYIHISWVT